MPSLKRARLIDEEPEESGFGLETEHFYNKSDSDNERRPDYGIPLNDDGRLRLRADIVLDEPRYAGVKGSRKSAFEEEDSEGSEEEDEDDDIASDGESLSHTDESSAEETDKLPGLQAGGLFDNELEALQREYADLQKQEGEMLKALKGHGDDDVQKSRAVSHQKALWERALEFRICLQKSFASANCLPQGIAKLELCQADTNVEKGYCKLKASSLGMLGLLSDILEDLFSQNPVITDTAPSDNDKKFQENEEAREDIDPVDAAWERMNSLYSRITPFRNASVDRWQRKTQLSTGAAASRNKLKALNQSISQQIKNFMRDPSRLVQRMQLRQSSAVHVLGMPRLKISEAAPDPMRDDVKDADLEIDNEEGGVECVNPELYDDSEFYQQLLQEFLESSDPTSLGMSINGSRKLQNKRRKVVDRRASKGRKIRYHVHEKIVNFMAPEPRNLPPMAEKLFMNLFGQGKVSS